MRIGIDYTAAARQGGGIGRYARELLTALLTASTTEQHTFILLAGTARLGACWTDEAARLNALAAPGTLRLRSLPLTDDWMARLWHRLRLPLPANAITGALDLFYAPDFLLPPLVGPVRRWVTIHDLSFMRHPETFPPQLRDYLTEAVPRSARRADHILTDSEWTRQDVIELLGLPAERVTALHLGVSPAFTPDPAPGEREALARTYKLGSAPYILAVGTVQPRKNYRRLIDAVERVRAGTEVDLVIAGGKGWLGEPILEAARERPWVRMLGFASDQDLPALYRQAAVLAFPSLYEGFGLPPLEAMACGTPVVASAASSVPEAVGDAGLLIDPRDTEALASALEQALTDTALRARLRAAGLVRASEFPWSRTATEWFHLLDR
jgi:glycosyltransferase involved in cell wall biosynthesis